MHRHFAAFVCAGVLNRGCTAMVLGYRVPSLMGQEGAEGASWLRRPADVLCSNMRLVVSLEC